VCGWRKLKELPEFFANAIDQLDKGGISPPLRSPNGFHLLRVKDIRSSTEEISTETRVRHILVKHSQASDEKTSKATLQAARKKIINGESFASLAKELSDDRNSANNGGELPWYKAGEMVPEFEKMASSLAPNQLSEMFRTDFGWHILEVLETRKVNVSEEGLRDDARQSLRKARTAEEYDLWLRRLRSEAYVEIRDAS
jgi:peptidyl-prolyl cis-trans isomerase SurA